MILCLHLVMACEFSSGLLPYIKILLSPPTSPCLCKNRTSASSLAGCWEFCCYFSSWFFWGGRQAPGKRQFCSFTHNLIRVALRGERQAWRCVSRAPRTSSFSLLDSKSCLLKSRCFSPHHLGVSPKLRTKGSLF